MSRHQSGCGRADEYTIVKIEQRTPLRLNRISSSASVGSPVWLDFAKAAPETSQIPPPHI